MYMNFEDLHKAYGFDNPSKTRWDLSEKRERQFVNDCFDLYEYIGFAKKFQSQYTDKKEYENMEFTVIDRVKEWTADSKEGVELEGLPMWNIQFDNGDIIMAYPEEICLAERK